MVKNPSASAKDTCLIPAPGRFHVPRGRKALAPQLMSPCDAAPEAGARPPKRQKPLQRKVCLPQLESNPHSLHAQEACMLNKDPTQPNINKCMKCLYTSHSCLTWADHINIINVAADNTA